MNGSLRVKKRSCTDTTKDLSKYVKHKIWSQLKSRKLLHDQNFLLTNYNLNKFSTIKWEIYKFHDTNVLML